MEKKPWTKKEYIDFVMINNDVNEEHATKTVEAIMRAKGYITNKEGVICTFKLGK